MIPESHARAVFQIWADLGEMTCRPIEGECMAPLIRGGDLLLIAHGNSVLRPGDVVVLGDADRYRVHRVIRVGREGCRAPLLLKSDRSGSPRVAVSRERVLGRVVQVRGPRGTFRLDDRFWRVVNALAALLSRWSLSPPSWAPGKAILEKVIFPAYVLSTRFPGKPIKEVGDDGRGETGPQGRCPGPPDGGRVGAL